MKEVWKIIPGLDGLYEASNLGRIRSFKGNGRGKAKQPRLLRQFQTPFGYKRIILQAGKKDKMRFVHNLVLEAFIGLKPLKKECAHLNGIRNDNNLINLKWVSRSENQLHRIKHGTDIRGTKHWASKLTNTEVFKIKKLSNLSYADRVLLAKKLSVSVGCIDGIVFRRNWKHI